ncbi:MAG TPA: 50S ribosomal protein L23 [Armatimonadetes bacterium]|nr:50S ribosomal protein L23 [Armatimonadota bacterium]
MKDPRDIIVRPVATEKSYYLATEQNKYIFQVHPEANKIEIRRAVEEIFNVEVVKVNTMWVRGKRRRLGRFPEGRTPRWKKAIVTVRPGQKIPIFEGV